MSKIVCEICGTTYQESAPCCPICGWAHNGEVPESAAAEEELDLDLLREELTEPAAPKTEAPASGRKIFDFDAENFDSDEEYENLVDEDTDSYEDVEEYEEEPHTNMVLVVFLVVLIVLLLLATGFVFFKFFLPGKTAAQETVPTVTETVVTEPETTEEPTIPCTNLVLPNGIQELNAEGQNWLLHVTVYPEDTTDELKYASQDESVAIVNEEGRVTAVAEGETNIVVTCGTQKIECPVTVRFVEETEPEETEPLLPGKEEKDGGMNLGSFSIGEDEAYTEEGTSSEPPKEGVVLALKKTDIQFGRYGVYTTLELDCDLSPSEVEWSSDNMYVAGVDAEGRVTALGPGIANITVKYHDQTAVCIVRCRF